MKNNISASELVIRPALFNDIPYIQELAQKTWPHAYENLLGRKQVEYMLNLFYSTAALEEQMKNNYHFYLALENYTPVGFASFSKIDATHNKLQKLYVLPHLQKSGIGQRLLDTVCTVSKSMEATKLSLNVNRGNAAKDFYKKLGFEIVREEDIDIGSGYFMNDYVMEKNL